MDAFSAELQAAKAQAIADDYAAAAAEEPTPELAEVLRNRSELYSRLSRSFTDFATEVRRREERP
jgi:CHASE2 domain-containing sensor protein